MSSYNYVILGGGLVAGYAARTLVQEGLAPGELCIISASIMAPHEHPPLSPDWQAGEEAVAAVLVNQPEFYAEHGIELRLSTLLSGVNFQKRQLYTSEGEVIEYGKLLIATGSCARQPEVPGTEQEGVYSLRQLADEEVMSRAADEATRAVVIGGNFMAMEVASFLQQEGVDTTLVFPERRIGQKFFTPQMSTFFEHYYLEWGIDMMPETEVVAFKGNGRLSHVVLDSGQELPVDMAVTGIGVAPNTDLFNGTGLEIDDGILVNRYLETNIPGVFAAGNVTCYPDFIYDKQRRQEYRASAVAQARQAALAMLGRRETPVYVPCFSSELFDLSYEFWGTTHKADVAVHRGDLEMGSFSVWWLREGQLQAAFVMDRPDEERKLAAEWVRTGQALSPQILADAGRPLQAT